MISVIIPTYNHLEDCLKPCIESIQKYTDFNFPQIEIIVVSNGSTDGTLEYLNELSNKDKRFRYLEFKESLGYTRATNEGLKVAKGNLIVFLNNDVELLPQAKNEWLKMLYKPLIGSDRKVGMTCPMKGFCHITGRYFPIFFCAMTTKSMIKEIGLLDEIFSPGGGEDCDWGHKLENKGYKIIQVPVDGYLATDSTGQYSVGCFPIWHKAEKTVHDPECVKDWGYILDKNTKILRDRYRKNGEIRKLKIEPFGIRFDGIDFEKYLGD
jgi:glycosyltransferase involved in cell wall biosynthesis